jgi:hypothetical protein
VRQLFEPALVDPAARTRALEGAAAAARPVFEAVDGDASFAVLHRLYWLTANLSSDRPLLLAPLAPRAAPRAGRHVTGVDSSGRG